MRSWNLFGVIGTGVLAVVCCAALPALAAFAGGLSVGALIGGGVGAVLIVGSAATLAVHVRRRRVSADRSKGARP